ncbi:FKBP-type peptidyl-prolyl cis-trans isomerase [Candidatus Leptofilum sp.]|uniref:FKBP-type peptidyl-prolyl cis-trans isomerase n=1 Tax=Candidatus Leptofilum sp. TaxID=3241576 RepID=UPI003B5B4540
MKIQKTNARNWHYLLLAAMLLGLLVAACGPATPQANDGETSDAVSEEGGSRVTASGLEYVEVEAGTGVQAQPGDLVSVHYTGTLADGTEFDSSAGGDPFSFVLGQGSVIPGWDEGIALMREGGKAQLIIPPELAYGANDYGPIPGNSTLTFDVELVAVDAVPTPAPPPTAVPPTTVDPDDYIVTDSGLQYIFLAEGDGDTPEMGEVVTVHFTGWFEDGTLFADSRAASPIEFIVGDEQILPGWDEAVLLMQVGDNVQMVLPPELGLGEEGSPNGTIPPNATLIFEMELLGISPPPPTPTPAPPPVSVDESDYAVTDSGLKLFVITPGTGEAIEAGDTVTLHYTVWEEDGTQLESSYNFGQPVPVIVGLEQISPGWDEALLLLENLSVAQFVLTPELAYGDQVDNAPEGNLIFEVEVLGLEKAETEE